MGKKYKRLYDQIIAEDNLQNAYKKASNGKKSSRGFLVFNEFAQAKLYQLHTQLINKTWQPQPYRVFTIYEPKKRIIGAPTFHDRIVHHALCTIIEPIFDKSFLPYSFACRTNKGTHAGVKFVQSKLRTGVYSYYLKTDFKAFFPSIDRPILHKQIRKKISCQDTLNLIEQIIPINGNGVPIGALTSQLSANIYGNIIDQYLHHTLKVPFARYMDDIIVLGNSQQELKKVKKQIEFFAKQEMKLDISRWQIAPISRGINFLGYRIWASHKLLRRSSVTRAKRKIKKYTYYKDFEALHRFIGSWCGHIGWADTHNLRVELDEQHKIMASLVQIKKRKRLSRQQMLEKLIQ